MNYGFLGHKHGYKHFVQYIARIGTVVSLVSAMLVPAPTHAFVGAFTLTASPKLLAQVDSTLNAFNLPSQDSYSLPTQGSAMQSMWANPSPITEKGEWDEKKVAAATPVVSTPKAERIYPKLDEPVVMEGEASYYSRAGCLGCDPNVIMANGQPLDDNALTMAIGADKKHLVGYKAKVTSLATGKSVVVRITDTGGFYQAKYGHRVADLTIATKEAIGIRGGVGQVRVEVF